MNDPEPKLIPVEISLKSALRILEETRIRLQRHEKDAATARAMITDLEQAILLERAKDVSPESQIQ